MQGRVPLKEENVMEKWLIGLALLFALLGFLLFIIISIWVFNALQHNMADSAGYLGNIGSFIGGVVGALWSLVSVLLFYVTLRLQQKEITLQRHELEMTRDEIRGQKEQMVLQNQTLVQQNFENTFFHLLKLHNNLVRALDLRDDQSRAVLADGRACFLMYYKRLETYVVLSSQKTGLAIDKADIDSTIGGYVQFFESNRNNLENYFRSLYQLFRFVDRSDVTISSSYAQFILAQLSSHELIILFYAGLNKTDGIKLKYYIEKFNLLQNLDTNLVFNQAHIQAYANQN